jgi:hypothetical protein
MAHVLRHLNHIMLSEVSLLSKHCNINLTRLIYSLQVNCSPDLGSHDVMFFLLDHALHRTFLEG